MPDGWQMTYLFTAIWCLFGVLILIMKRARDKKKHEEEERKRRIIEETRQGMEGETAAETGADTSGEEESDGEDRNG